MLSIAVGPLALPLAPLLLLLGTATALALASRLARRAGATGDAAAARLRAAQAGDAVTSAALLGLLAARGVFVALHATAYLAAPWAVIDIRDGGWHAPAGFAAGAAWLLWRAWRAPVLRRALALGASAGAALWGVLTLAASLHGNLPLPALTVDELATGAPRTLVQAAAGRPVVVVLWASWCGPCREELPLLAAAQQRETGVGFLFVNQGEDPRVVRAFLDGQRLALRNVLLDRRAALGAAVGSPGLPTTLFYDASGRQVDAHFGLLNAAALESRLWLLRPGPTPF